jgi:hypothetical protein
LTSAEYGGIQPVKSYLSVGATLLMGASASVSAATCAESGYTQSLDSDTTPTLNEALNGKRINATAPDGEEWNEDHCPNGALYKVAAPPAQDPKGVDPRAFRGVWQGFFLP